LNSIRKLLSQFENLFRNSGDVINGFPASIPLDELKGREQYDPAMLEENLMFGSPDTVIAKLKQYQSLGVNEFIYYASMGLSHEAQKRSLRMFCKEVMPELK
jgi:alkanesulfonate monooxygenase SsuD/methylene tetrahydromethanopterin reductase-like flavin-dependent oxidoreductase (luciferase family)